MFARDRREMPRADDAFAPRQVASEVGDGVEFARKKLERRLIKDMDKAAVGLHVADGKRLEAVGPGIDMVIAFECGVDRKIARRFLVVFGASLGSAERDRNEMDSSPLGWGKRERESLLACRVEK